MLRRLGLAALIAAALCGPAMAAKTPDIGVMGLVGKLEAARQKKAHPEAIALAEQLLAVDPAHPTLRAAYARTLSAAGEEARALAQASWLAEHGHGLDPRAQRDLGPLLAKPEHAALAKRLAQNVAPVGRLGAEVVAKQAFASEGVDYDAGQRRFFLGVANGDVQAMNAAGETTRIYQETRPGRATYGVRFDARRDRLLFCSNPAEGAEGKGGAELVVRSLRDGAEERRPLPGEGEHICNDIALFTDGRAVITDTAAGKLWLHAPGQALKPFSDTAFVFPNGVTVSAHRRQVFVADFLGVWALGEDGRFLGRVEPAGEEYLGGVDGLYAIGERLVGVQNITTPPRVWTADVRKDLSGCVRVLASAQPRLEGMTTAAVVGERVAVLSRTGVGMQPPKTGEGPALVWVDVPKRACG